jgi:AcrR family transcriptional regulator
MPRKAKKTAARRSSSTVVRKPRSRKPRSADAPLGKQAAKTKLAREKIIGAVISLIKEGGYSNASSSRIAERAGMTWGAAQHHFGSKDEIMIAILDLSHERFTARMADPALRAGSVAERAGRFIDRMWEHYQDDIYIVVLEILLATRGFHQAAPSSREESHARAHHESMREIFADIRLDAARARETMTFAHFSLTGLAIEHVFEGKVRNMERYLQRIKLTVQTMLTA